MATRIYEEHACLPSNATDLISPWLNISSSLAAHSLLFVQITQLQRASDCCVRLRAWYFKQNWVKNYLGNVVQEASKMWLSCIESHTNRDPRLVPGQCRPRSVVASFRGLSFQMTCLTKLDNWTPAAVFAALVGLGQTFFLGYLEFALLTGRASDNSSTYL